MEDPTIVRNCTPVTNFYFGKSIFVTGGSGFLGKVLVEKLLWSCSGIENIYLLLRSKKCKDVNSRLQEVLNTPVFDRLRREKPQELQKIIPVLGDISKEQMGINDQDKEILRNKITVVFNVGAMVKFKQTLKEAVTVNSIGCSNVIDFFLKKSCVQAFVHISTAFSNCIYKQIKEEIYPLQYDPKKLIQLLELDAECLEVLTPKLLQNHPNVYTFSKALAESILQAKTKKFSVAVVRPSIVLSSMREPMEGWIDSWNGPAALVAAGGQGLLHKMQGDSRVVANVVPVDLVANLIICAAWRIATQSIAEVNVEVYNSCTGAQNPITWGAFNDCCSVGMAKNPLEGIMTEPYIGIQSRPYIFRLQTFFLEVLPVYILNLLCWIAGKKIDYVLIYNKVATLRDAVHFFSSQHWKFEDDNVNCLNRMLEEEDRKIFPFDVRKIHWPSYLENYCLGIRHFLLKNQPNSIPHCRKQLKMVTRLNRIAPILVIVVILLLLNGLLR